MTHSTLLHPAASTAIEFLLQHAHQQPAITALVIISLLCMAGRAGVGAVRLGCRGITFAGLLVASALPFTEYAHGAPAPAWAFVGGGAALGAALGVLRLRRTEPQRKPSLA